MENQTMPAG
jgi:Ras-related GTP-binding protein A/B